jgi:hypothetical protein
MSFRSSVPVRLRDQHPETGSIPGSSTKKMQVRDTFSGLFLFSSTLHQHWRQTGPMASLRSGTRKDGSTYIQVLYRLDGKQTSTSFHDVRSATKFKKLVDAFGPAKAVETLIPSSRSSPSPGGSNIPSTT